MAGFVHFLVIFLGQILSVEMLQADIFDICGHAVGSVGKRIVGGQSETQCKHPWVVTVYNSEMNYLCGGSILDKFHILSAAHCLWTRHGGNNISKKTDASYVTIHHGSYKFFFDEKLQTNVDQIILHENYSDVTKENDIAILVLSSPLVFGRCQLPLCMVDPLTKPEYGVYCVVMGWGFRSSNNNNLENNLQYTDVTVDTDVACSCMYKKRNNRTTFCASQMGKGVCVGDDGGPLACADIDERYYLYGIVSKYDPENCGTSLDLYTNVATYRTWIDLNTNRTNS